MKEQLQNIRMIKLISFICTIAITFLYIQMAWNRIIVNDALYYWTTVTSFNIDYLPMTFRGYFYTYLIYAVKTLSVSIGFSEYFLFILMNSVLCALFVTVFLPAIAVGGIKRSREIPVKRYLLGTALILFFILYFWPDFIMYPLSDFPALVFCAAAIYFMMIIHETISKDNIENKHSILVKITQVLIIAILAGFCAYAAYNIRAIYLYGLVLSFFIWLIKNRKSNKRLLFTALIGIIIGLFMIAYPQMHVNQRYQGSYNPKVPTENFYGADLVNAQLAGGLTADRFDGHVFEDKSGKLIIQTEGVTTVLGVKQLIQLCIKYPMDMAGIYSRHIINYLTPIWNHVYIDNTFTKSIFFIIPGILLWLVAGYCLLLYSRQQYKKWLMGEAWIQLPLIIICLFMIPGFVEARFFLSGYFLMYGFLCYRVDYKNVYLQSFKKHPIRILLIMLLISLMWVAIISSTLANSVDGVLLINH